MESLRTPTQEAAEDIFFGQVVTIWARWFLILTGAIITLWTASTVEEITTRLPLIIVLMAVNFFLHGRYLMGQPANRMLILAASVLDLLVITGVVLTWQGGLASQFFVFYYPVLVGFAFVFPARLTALYTFATLVAYSLACFAAEPQILGSQADVKTLVMRLITLAAMGGLGTYYWRIQRDRRRAAEGQTTSQLGTVQAVRAGLQPAARGATRLA